MSGSSGADEDPDLDTLAGEYVLGVLEETDRRGVRLRARQEPELADAIAAWEQRLAPMAELLTPIAPPPALWARIAAAIEAAPPDIVAMPPPRAVAAAPRRRGWGWPLATAASLALAAGLAAFVVLKPPSGPVRVAALAPINAPAPAFVAQAQADGTVTLAAVSPQDVPAGKDLELWVLAPGAQKVASLGLLPKGGRTLQLSAPPATGTQFLISLEPQGGSTTGQPTGPVLYGGTFTGPVAALKS